MPKHYQTLRLLTYKVNRPLSEDEIRNHLPQKVLHRSAPWYQLSVIRMNSTFLECVDKFYGIRGGMTTVIIAVAPMIFHAIWIGFSFLFRALGAPAEEVNELLLATVAWFFMLLPLLVLCIYSLRFDCFRYTHYPLRFNRKTRMVHVFRPSGKVLSVPWDKIYFTLGYCTVGVWEVVGHILSEDGKTVLDTFPLSTRSLRDDWSQQCTLYQQWEFIRQYMEDGPCDLYDQVSVVFPIDKKKETFSMGLNRFLANVTFSTVLMLIMLPLVFLASIGRWIAMRTCKIPRWPEEVEAESVIDPHDPYIRDEHNLSRSPFPPPSDLSLG